MAIHKKRFVKLCANCAVLISLLAMVPAAPAQSVPQEILGDDITSMILTWNWTRVRGTNDAIGFRIYCGDFTNNSADGTTEYYTEMQDVPDKTARSYLIWPIIQSLAKREGSPRPPLYAVALHVRCRVVAYNAAGESEDAIKGVPSKPTAIKFVRK